MFDRVRAPVMGSVTTVCAVAGAVVMCAQAGAQVRPLASRDFERPPAPALAGDRVVWSQTVGDGTFRLMAAPRAGGTARRVGQVASTGDGYELAGSAERVLFRRKGSSGRDRLFGAANGPLRQIGPLPLSVPDDAFPNRSLWAVGNASVTLERTPGARRRLRLVVRRPGGPATVVRLRGDVEAVDVAGGFAAVAVERDGESPYVALIELGSGTVVRRVDPGPLGAVLAVGLAPDGSVAVSGYDSRKRGRLAFASPADQTLRQVSKGEFDEVAPAAGRIGVVTPVRQPGGVGEGSARVQVLRPLALTGRSAVEFRGPAAADLEGLQFDGAYATWASGGCQVLADTAKRTSVRVLPRGPCVRTEIESKERFVRKAPDFSRTAAQVRVGCLTTPTQECRVRFDARVISQFSPRIGSVSARIPAGQARTLTLTLTRRAKRLVQRLKSLAYFEVLAVDPDGRSRLEDILGV